MKYYKPNHFKIQELVHPNIYNIYGDGSLKFLNPYMLWTLDALRDEYDSCTINDWLWGGVFKNSGLREKSSSVGADYSSHKFGCGFDLKFKYITAEEIRQDMLRNPDKLIYQYITRVEHLKNGIPISWLHIDNYNVDTDGIYFFNV